MATLCASTQRCCQTTRRSVRSGVGLALPSNTPSTSPNWIGVHLQDLDARLAILFKRPTASGNTQVALLSSFSERIRLTVSGVSPHQGTAMGVADGLAVHWGGTAWRCRRWCRVGTAYHSVLGNGSRASRGLAGAAWCGRQRPSLSGGPRCGRFRAPSRQRNAPGPVFTTIRTECLSCVQCLG
jgi:hypothetical protein